MNTGSISFRRSTETLDGSTKETSDTTTTLFNIFETPTITANKDM